MGTRQSHFISLRSGRLPLVLRMKLLLVWCLVLFSLAALALAQQEDVVSNCAKQCGKGCKCPCAAANTKPFVKYTKMKGKGKNKKPVADAQCQFDPSMGKKCGRCIKGGKQCGPPMHQWCQNPKSKMGCKGIPNFKYSLSSRGKRSFSLNLDHDLEVILGTFTTDTTSQLDVLGHDGNALGVDCAQVGVLEQANEVGLGCFLKSSNSS